MKGKNKLVPRLLGITKECVMRVDEKTKEVIQEWSLTNIKRWAASPKSFTLVWTSPGPAQPFPNVDLFGGCSHTSPSLWCCPMAGQPCPRVVPLLALVLKAGSWVLSTYQRGSGWLPVPSSGATLCPAIAGFWRLPGWLLLSADNRRRADRPADCWLH